MKTVIVYNFEVSDIREGKYVLAKYKAPRPFIEAHGNARVVEGTGEEVDESQLEESGQYHGPSENGS